jgi:hypothetical protein
MSLLGVLCVCSLEDCMVGCVVGFVMSARGSQPECVYEGACVPDTWQILDYTGILNTAKQCQAHARKALMI